MTLFDGLLALMLVLLTAVALGRWLLQLLDCLLPVSRPVQEEPARLQLTLRVDTLPTPPFDALGENTPIVCPYPPGRRIGERFDMAQWRAAVSRRSVVDSDHRPPCLGRGAMRGQPAVTACGTCHKRRKPR